jgi:hypothetical protein
MWAAKRFKEICAKDDGQNVKEDSAVDVYSKTKLEKYWVAFSFAPSVNMPEK